MKGAIDAWQRPKPKKSQALRKKSDNLKTGADSLCRSKRHRSARTGRNAYAAARALDANLYSSFTDGMHRVSFDKVVEVMKETGNDLPSLYKETSEGGLAKDYKPM